MGRSIFGTNISRPRNNFVAVYFPSCILSDAAAWACVSQNWVARTMHMHVPPMKTHTANTYDLIIESEDKNRTVLETAIYALFILSAVVSIFQFVAQPIVVPTHTAAFASTETIATGIAKI
jgi:hypothetical protein